MHERLALQTDGGATRYAAPARRRRASELLLVAVVSALHAWAWDFVSDDTFINLRYSQNLLAGHGLVFNAGERVEAFSSLTWVLLTASLAALGSDLLVAARSLGLLRNSRDASLRKVARTHRRSGGKDVGFSHSRDAAERR
jgi:hypothetical protein